MVEKGKVGAGEAGVSTFTTSNSLGIGASDSTLIC